MKTEKFLRKSFPVEGIQVTEENFLKVAEWTKGKVCETDATIAEKFNKPVLKWIEIEVKDPKNERQTKAFVGDYVLYANRGFKIYTAGAFERNFEPVFKPAQAPKITADNGHDKVEIKTVNGDTVATLERSQEQLDDAKAKQKAFADSLRVPAAKTNGVKVLHPEHIPHEGLPHSEDCWAAKETDPGYVDGGIGMYES